MESLIITGMKNILISCEFSGLVREAFKKKGWNAWSCDLLETEIPGQHYCGDVRDILYQNWDALIFHAPCTYMTNSGVRWLYNPDGTKKTQYNYLPNGHLFSTKQYQYTY